MMFPINLIYPVFYVLLPVYKRKEKKPNVSSRKYPEEIRFKPEQELYQSMALYPLQMLPYQYYQISMGKFLLPSAYFLYTFFLPDYPFQETQYKQTEFKQAVFEEKGEYSQ